MTQYTRKVVILMVDDDPDDCVLMKDALGESDLYHEIWCVEDGVEMMEYLTGSGKYSGGDAPRPDLILLDLNMPRKSGLEALKEVKQDVRCQDIPVVILTMSDNPADIRECYNLGAVAFFTKPTWFADLMEIIKVSGKYWFKFLTMDKNS